MTNTGPGPGPCSAHCRAPDVSPGCRRGQSIAGPGLCPKSCCLLPPVPWEGPQFCLGGQWGQGWQGCMVGRRQRKPGHGARAVSKWCSGHGEWVAGLLLLELGLRLGLQLPGGGTKPPPSRPPPPGCPLRVSKPSEFSSISWMRGGMEPGISIFSVITRSAPAGREGGGQYAHPGQQAWLQEGGPQETGRQHRDVDTHHTLHLGLSYLT